MQVAVNEVEMNGTISIGRGTDEDGRAVHFAGDWRPMAAIAAAIDAGEVPIADVPDYAVLYHGPKLPDDTQDLLDNAHDRD